MISINANIEPNVIHRSLLHWFTPHLAGSQTCWVQNTFAEKTGFETCLGYVCGATLSGVEQVHEEVNKIERNNFEIFSEYDLSCASIVVIAETREELGR